MPSRTAIQELFCPDNVMDRLVLSYATHAAGLSLALGPHRGMRSRKRCIATRSSPTSGPSATSCWDQPFVTVGMMLDVMYVLTHLPCWYLAVFLSVVGRAQVLLVAAIRRAADSMSARVLMAQLAQAGEFGLVLIQPGFALKPIGRCVPADLVSHAHLHVRMALPGIEWATRFSGRWYVATGRKAKMLYEYCRRRVFHGEPRHRLVVTG